MYEAAKWSRTYIDYRNCSSRQLSFLKKGFGK